MLETVIDGDERKRKERFNTLGRETSKKELEYLKPFLPKNRGKIYKMPYSEMQTWSDLTT
ncbi:hypothetical protein NQ317_019733 [Molorchus minor]|uniref:Uncharacterized protein n=1 Tax=Molorchus minor TaxID=1323400 RepID=A0ABQ9IRN8_9CUCU|nr:hypothetical protein NQ317_019733 [Molorchus minor]